jgi:hypothetical protein
VFLPATSGVRASRLLSAVGDRPILTVGESAGFVQAGGLINFLVDDNRVVFEIDLERVSASPVKLSSHLLKLARPAKAAPLP